MTALNLNPIGRHDLRMALTVTRREVKDALRDYRMVIPIVLLTLAFPALMNFAARQLMAYVGRFDSAIIGDRLIPLLLMIVGFFPTSFSLIIALETFVGEKERKSLEPLLATPLTDSQLYLGKLLAALLLPLAASYMGITVYTVSIIFTTGLNMSPGIFILVVLLTTVQGLIMVAGAVVVSSQTTSVRAANLLASFIIVPMALLIQFEAAMMFWGNQAGLWWLLLALTITAIIFLRMGLHLFNREELLGRDIDQIRPRWILGQFWARFSGRDEAASSRRRGPLGWYARLFRFLPQLRQPLLISLLALLAALTFGAYLGVTFPLSDNVNAYLSGSDRGEHLRQLQLMAAYLPLGIFGQNTRALLLAALLGIFSLGVGNIGIFALPWVIVGYIGAQLAPGGAAAMGFLFTALAPHAVFELPALLLATSAGLRWQAVVMNPPRQGTVSEAFLNHAADFARVFIGLVLPLLLIAAFVEAYVTPALLVRYYGG